MAKTIEQKNAEKLALLIQEFTIDNPECNDMRVEDFVFHLLDFYKGENDANSDDC